MLTLMMSGLNVLLQTSCLYLHERNLTIMPWGPSYAHSLKNIMKIVFSN